MRYPEEFVERFRRELGVVQPQKPERAHGFSKQRLVASVRPQIELWRRDGFSLDAIAQCFTQLGVTMSAATLRTCLRRSAAPTSGARGKPKTRSAGARRLAREPQGRAVPPEAPATNGPRDEQLAERGTPPDRRASLDGIQVPQSYAQPAGDTHGGGRETDSHREPGTAIATSDEVPRDVRPVVAGTASGGPAGHDKRPYRSTIIIRPEKPLSAFKETP